MDEFSEFWNLFPKIKTKGSKQYAKFKFDIALRDNDFINIKIGLKKYIKWLNHTGQVSNNTADTWLENQMWKDDWFIPEAITVTSAGLINENDIITITGHNMPKFNGIFKVQHSNKTKRR